MKTFQRRLWAGLGLVWVLIVLSAIIAFRQRPDPPFRCSAFTRYNLSRDNHDITLSVAQDLRLMPAPDGYLLMNGRAVSDGAGTVLNRVIRLGDGGKIDEDTYRYHIDKIIVSSTDTTPDALFKQLLTELTTDNETLQLDVVHIEGKAFLIGGPVSYLFTCTTY